MTKRAITAAICTYGRTEGVERAIRSVLNDPAVGQLIVVDQNLDDRIVPLIAAVDPARTLHIRTDIKGAGRARNIALNAAQSEVVCFTDDDCEANLGWATTMTDEVLSDSRVGLVFSNVDEPDDGETGFTPSRVFDQPAQYLTWSRSPTPAQLGIGASYAIRVEAGRQIGGWDEAMGPGGHFPSADDVEIAYRLLLDGWAVRCTPSTAVLHLGRRSSGTEIRGLNKRDYRALGAMYAKLTKARPRPSAAAAFRFLLTTFRDSARDSRTLRRPAGFGRWVWLLVGFGQGLRMPVDRDRICFRR